MHVYTCTFLKKRYRKQKGGITNEQPETQSTSGKKTQNEYKQKTQRYIIRTAQKIKLG